MALTWYTTQGIPSDSIGVQGDMAFDTTNRFFWGPKGASSWVGTQTNANPQFPNLYGMPAMAAAFGPACQFSGQTMGTSTSGSNIAFMFNGTTTPYIFTPLQASALTGLNVTNFSATGATVYFYLQDLTANSIVFNYNSGNGIASGTVASVALGNSAYPLVAGHQYQWQGIRGTAGATYVQINPQYLTPSTTSTSSVGYFPSVFTAPTSNTSVASAGTVYFQQAGMAPQSAYYRNGSASYMYYLQVTASGSGTFAPYFYNDTAGANGPAPNATGVLTSTVQTFTFGPYAAGTFPFNAAQTYDFRLYASGTALTVNAGSYAQMMVGQ